MLTLKERPDLFKETIKLIEKCFLYNDENSFAVDFAPLIDESNWHHCYILLSEDQKKVVAHIGLKKRYLLLNGTEYPILLAGGICVDEKYRGKGIFKDFYESIMKAQKQEYLACLLWSDQDELYSKFNFYQIGGQVQLGNSEVYDLEHLGYKKTEWSDLDPSDFLHMTQLYDQYIADIISIKREMKDWDLIKRIFSTSLYTMREGKEIVSYLFLGKGQDLKGIIHELVYKKGAGESLLKNFSNHKLWIPEGLGKQDENSQVFYTAFMKITDENLFKDFLDNWSNGDVKLISYNDKRTKFQFSGDEYDLDSVEFLRYVFGPSPLLEFASYFKPLFISGLDSI